MQSPEQKQLLTQGGGHSSAGGTPAIYPQHHSESKLMKTPKKPGDLEEFSNSLLVFPRQGVCCPGCPGTQRSTCVWLLGDGINSAYRCLAPPVYFNHQRKKDNLDVLQVARIYEVHTFTLRLVRSMPLPGDFRHAGRVLKLQLSQLSTFSVDVYNIPTYSAKHAWGPCPDYTAIIRTYTDKIKANKLISWPA